MISSGAAGPLGVLHVPRFWLKVSLEEQGKLGARLSWHRQRLRCNNRQIANALPPHLDERKHPNLPSKR
jgi:hypothetical protein